MGPLAVGSLGQGASAERGEGQNARPRRGLHRDCLPYILRRGSREGTMKAPPFRNQPPQGRLAGIQNPFGPYH